MLAVAPLLFFFSCLRHVSPTTSASWPVHPHQSPVFLLLWPAGWSRGVGRGAEARQPSGGRGERVEPGV